MRKTCAVLALILAGLVVGAYGVGAEERVPAGTATHPPKNLKQVGDHWTPWDPPAAGPDSYIIQRGDTLWDLAGKWLGNTYLWPQIWDLNRYVLDSHWIYPGDPLGVPGKPTAVPPGGPPPAPAEEAPAAAAPQETAPAAPPPAMPPPAPLFPVADAVDVYCSGVIEPSHQPSSLRILGRETERKRVAQGDVVYLNQGRSQGVAAGAAYQVQRAENPVVHPVTKASLGTFVERLGKIRILAVQENTSTAVIEQSCGPMSDGDEIVPWREIPIPRMASLPKFDRWNAEPSGGPSGVVVATRDNLTDVGGGNVLFADVGIAKGVIPGDVLRVYRDQPGGLPRMMLGQAVVLEAGQDTSAVKVTVAVKEIGVGDAVELER